jgi:hypothetical protein
MSRLVLVRKPYLVDAMNQPTLPVPATHELVRATEEDFGGEVSSQFAAKWALDGDGLKWKFIPTGRHMAVASVAGHHEYLAISVCREHASMIANRLRKSSDHQHTCLYAWVGDCSVLIRVVLWTAGQSSAQFFEGESFKSVSMN